MERHPVRLILQHIQRQCRRQAPHTGNISQLFSDQDIQVRSGLGHHQYLDVLGTHDHADGKHLRHNRHVPRHLFW